ncbi:MAG: ATP-grasp domain-containing protein, partial [Candidatus Binataceae bacterium]
ILDKRAGTLSIQLCRALARQWRQVDIWAERDSPAFRSRYCANALETPPWNRDHAGPALAQIVEEKPYEAIYICSEEILEIVHRIPRSRAWERLPLSEFATIETLLSKNATLAKMTQAGVGTPRTIIPSDEHEVEHLGNDLGIPLMIKGERGDSGRNVVMVNRREDLVPTYRQIARREQEYGGRPALQELIRGDAYSVGGLYLEGRALRICAHRKLLTYPPSGGWTVKGVTERPKGLLEECMKAFAALRYTGLGHAEFIRDRRDGRYKFIEVNPRIWGSIGIVEHAGVDLYQPYHALARGLAVEPDLRFKEGVLYHRFSGEVRLIRRRPLRVAGFFKDALDPRVRSDFEWSDAKPHLFSLAFSPHSN